MGVQRHNVPHFKGLIVLYLNSRISMRGSTFTFCHGLMKKAILLLKMADVPFDLLLAVLYGLFVRDSASSPGVGVGNTPYQVLPVEFRHVPGKQRFLTSRPVQC